ncbi:hypothetical protein GBAR_LOCUS11386, partial [Geodia barretti]
MAGNWSIIVIVEMKLFYRCSTTVCTYVLPKSKQPVVYVATAVYRSH